MTERDFRIVSVDDHLVQPPDLWESRLPRSTAIVGHVLWRVRAAT